MEAKHKYVVCFIILHFCCFLVDGLALISQPWPIKIDKIASCCMYLNSKCTSKFIDASTLHQCIRKRSNMDVTVILKDTSVALFSLALNNGGEYNIPSITNFTQYQVALVSAYASHNNYVFKSFESLSGPVESDVRWNKVKMFSDALSPVDGWARDVEYLVWIDADAIILDFNLRIEGIGRQFPESDIIASSDIRMGLINTGLLVVRNTAWSRSFLDKWWTVADRNKVCDQDAFDLLYQQYLQSEKISPPLSPNSAITQKVRVLPMDRLNSHPPAMLHQQPHNAVLHLMGETTPLRSAVFHRALTAVCDARSGGVLPPQLGVTREVLLAIASDVYSADVQSQLVAANQSSATYETFEALSRSAHHYCDILTHLAEVQETKSAAPAASHTQQRDYHSDIYVLRRDLFDIILRNVDALRVKIVSCDAQLQQIDARFSAIKGDTSDSLYADFLAVKGERRDSVSELLGMLKRAAEAGNDLFWVSPSFELKLLAAQKVFGILEDLTSRVASESLSVPLHMTALMHQNVGALQYDVYNQLKVTQQPNNTSHLFSAQKSLQHSVSIFENKTVFSLASDSSTQIEYTYSLQLLSAITCTIANVNTSNSTTNSNYLEGTTLWSRTVQHARGQLKGVEFGMHFENYAIVLYNAAICYNDAQMWSEARDLLSECETVQSKIIKHREATQSSQQISDIINTDSFMLNVRNLLQTVTQSSENNSDIASVTTSSPPQLHSLRSVSTPEGGVKYLQDATSTSTEEVEWEECSESEVLNGECEDVIVVDEEEEQLTTATVPLIPDHEPHRVVTFPPDDPSVYEGLTKRQREELEEVRERYALQAGRYFVNSRSGGGASDKLLDATTKPTVQTLKTPTPTVTSHPAKSHDNTNSESHRHEMPSSLAAAVDRDVMRSSEKIRHNNDIDSHSEKHTVAKQHVDLTDTITKSHANTDSITATANNNNSDNSQQSVLRLQYQVKSLQVENEGLTQEVKGLKDKVKYLEALLGL